MTIALGHLLTKTCRCRARIAISARTKAAVSVISDVMRLETPNGTRDFDTTQTAIRQRIIEQIVTVFRKHGAANIETPDFELKEIVAGKYGEQSYRVYNLVDQGGELLALRYDLTVPFARYLAMNKITNMKRYQVEKVYRRDEPCPTTGCLRELYQCDFDIAGLYDPMIADAECIRIVYEIFETLRLGDYRIRVNHRRLVDGILAFCGVRSQDFKAVCASIDKLDKEKWEMVRDELINVRRLSAESVDKIGEFVRKKGSIFDVIDVLEQNDDLMRTSKAARDGVDEMKLLFDYVRVQDVDSKVLVFDLSLTRGSLDYYTAVVFEVVLSDDNNDECARRIGAVAGGGRYDSLVSSLDASKRSTPCVGLSIGVERIFAAIETYGRGAVSNRGTDVYVISTRNGLVEERMKVCSRLWDGEISVEHSNRNDPTVESQLAVCETNRIPFAVIIEAENQLKLREIATRTEIEIGRNDLVEQLQLRLRKINATAVV